MPKRKVNIIKENIETMKKSLPRIVKLPVFKKREIGVALNNAVAHIVGSEDLADMSNERRRKLRNYVAAALEPLIEHVEECFLTPEELTYCLSVGALFVYRLMILKGGKLPMFDVLASEMAGELEKEVGDDV